MMLKKICSILLICMIAAGAVLLAPVASDQASAADEPSGAFYSLLEQKDIHFSRAEVQDQVLSIDLISDSEEYCTLADVKAMQALYELIHAGHMGDDVRDLDTTVYSPSGRIIYQMSEKGVYDMIKDMESLVQQEPEQDITLMKESVNALVQDTVRSFPVTIQEQNIVPASEISGYKLVLSLKLLFDDYTSIAAVGTLYEKLEAYALSSEQFSQCELTLLNTNGECIYYMTGDFLHGNCVAWVSPETRQTFTEMYGPKPE